MIHSIRSMGAAESTACCVASRGDKADADSKNSKNSSLVPEKRESIINDGMNLSTANSQIIITRIQTTLEHGKSIFEAAKGQSTKEGETFEDAVDKFLTVVKLSRKLYTYGKEQRESKTRHQANVYEGRSLSLIAFVFEIESKFLLAIDNCDGALKLLKEPQSDEERLHKIFCLGIIWRCYCKLSEYEQAIYFNNLYVNEMKDMNNPSYKTEITQARKARVAMAQFQDSLERIKEDSSGNDKDGGAASGPAPTPAMKRESGRVPRREEGNGTEGAGAIALKRESTKTARESVVASAN